MRSAPSEQQLADIEASLAREARAATTNRLAFAKFYNRTRMLEAAIKKHAQGACSCEHKGECLTRLVALTPVNTRPTLTMLRRGRRK